MRKHHPSDCRARMFLQSPDADIPKTAPILHPIDGDSKFFLELNGDENLGAEKHRKDVKGRCDFTAEAQSSQRNQSPNKLGALGVSAVNRFRFLRSRTSPELRPESRLRPDFRSRRSSPGCDRGPSPDKELHRQLSKHARCPLLDVLRRLPYSR